MLDSLKLYESEFRALLPDDETPLVAVSCSVAFGADRLERSPEELKRLFGFFPRGARDRAVELLTSDPAPTRDQKAWEKALDLVVDTISGDLVKGDPDEWIGGVAAAGHAGSIAHRLVDVLEARNPESLITDRRLIFVDWRAGGKEFEELISLPRQAVVAARRAGRFMQRGRVVLDFVDLSQLALMTGMLFTGQARRFVAGLHNRTERHRD